MPIWVYLSDNYFTSLFDMLSNVGMYLTSELWTLFESSRKFANNLLRENSTDRNRDIRKKSLKSILKKSNSKSSLEESNDNKESDNLHHSNSGTRKIEQSNDGKKSHAITSHTMTSNYYNKFNVLFVLLVILSPVFISFANKTKSRSAQWNSELELYGYVLL